MWILVAMVAVAAIVIVVAGRFQRGTEAERGPTGRPIDGIDDGGLRVGDDTIRWSEVYRVVAVTRSGVGRSWFGFEIATERGPVVAHGPTGMAERFLASAHHLPGFGHPTVAETLAGRNGTAVCFER